MPEWLGKTLGQVRIEKLLARGGMAEVYLGTHLTLEQPVAVKVLHSYIEEDPLLLERFQREARVVAGLRHPNIVRVFDFDTADNHPYIIMEYLKGPTLEAYLRPLHQRKKRLPLEGVSRLLSQLASGLDYAHERGVIHRDIKPGNMLLDDRAEEVLPGRPLPDNVQVILTDFGLVRFVDSATQTVSGFISATPTYASPEQARGDQMDHRTDLYSLGVVLYEMLAGHAPFEADNAVAMLHMHIHTAPPPIAGIPASVQDVVDHALQKKPADRFQGAMEMSNALESAISGAASPQPIQEQAPAPPASAGSTAVSTTPAAAVPAPVAPRSRPPQSPAAAVEQAALEPAAARSPRRGLSPAWIWIGAGLFVAIAIALVALGAPRFLATGGDAPETALPTSAAGAGPAAAAHLPSPANMVQIAAGSYEVGTSQFVDEFHVAPRQVQLQSYWIDQYQTTNAEYQQYMTATGAPAPLVWPGEPKHPARGVTWEQASAYCAWMNKRLPDEAEWEAAGRGPGPNPSLYPWGNDATAGGAALSLPSQDTFEVGSQAFDVSASQVHDLVGNIWEWVGQPYASVPDASRVLRGGRFGNPQDLAYRLVVSPGEKIIQYAGFRCAATQIGGN